MRWTIGQNNQTATVANNLLDPQNIRAEYGNSITNIPNRLVADAVVIVAMEVHRLEELPAERL